MAARNFQLYEIGWAKGRERREEQMHLDDQGQEYSFDEGTAGSFLYRASQLPSSWQW